MQENTDLQIHAVELISLTEEEWGTIESIRSPESPGFIQLKGFPEIAKSFLDFMDRHLTNLNDKHRGVLPPGASNETTDMTRFISALRIANAKNELKKPLQEEIDIAAKLINTFSKSGIYRLYTPIELKKAKETILEWLIGSEKDHFNYLFDNATTEQKYRLPDLFDYPTFLQECIILCVQNNPNSLTEFIEITLFFIALAKELKGFYHKDDSKGKISKNEYVNGLLSKDGAKHLTVFRQYRNVANRIKGNNENTLTLENEDINKFTDDFIAQLNFSSDTALAYHVKSHLKELPENENGVNYPRGLEKELEQIYADTSYYLEKARDTIKWAKNKVPPDYTISYCQFNNHPIFKFTLNDGNGLDLLTIVKCDADGQAFIATHMGLSKQ